MSILNKKTIHANLIKKHEAIFQCPVCSRDMHIQELRSMVCTQNHFFDLAKQGYLNLITHSLKTKYDKHLFESRKRIADSGFFDPLTSELSEMLNGHFNSNPDEIKMLDAGSGEGSHLSSIQKKLFDKTGKNLVGIGADIAKEGVYIAAREYSGLIWCVADLANSPFKNHAFNCILSILSPSNYAEFDRLLSDGGLLVKVIPESGYLKELREIFYGQTDKEDYSNHTTIERFQENFKLAESKRITYQVKLAEGLLEHIINMTPLSWGSSPEQLKKAVESDISTLTVDLTILAGKRSKSN
ncbi:putative RNA methyltransferase [Metabacillus sp. RGM 3146]|uniref:putative RNA methyltransferase n=1 Tax=Metabacillus sp. RGM 3146 TaxID=3401092 RepID=UPI003B9B099D